MLKKIDGVVILIVDKMNYRQQANINYSEVALYEIFFKSERNHILQ